MLIWEYAGFQWVFYLGTSAAAASVGPAAAPAVPQLTQTLADKEVYPRLQAVIALGEIGPAAASARDALKGCLRDNHPAVRQSAGRSLKQINALPVAPDD